MASKKPSQYTVTIGKWSQSAKSTNLLERLNQEVRRREKIIRIFLATERLLIDLLELSLWEP